MHLLNSVDDTPPEMPVKDHKQETSYIPHVYTPRVKRLLRDQESLSSVEWDARFYSCGLRVLDNLQYFPKSCVRSVIGLLKRNMLYLLLDVKMGFL